MKKRLVFLMLAIIFALTSFGSVVLANNEKVEVEFCVGDDTLMINGEAVVVEKPYVVGAGVTLVPLRVITEAFGALVEWIGETKTINLAYPDVNIVLQIDNPVAEINGRAETLLAAPELTQNGFTMVPLRFISENFGATVSYDEETQRITVTKETSAPVGSTVEGATDNKYIGDSYYKWYMENPKDMVMSERRFDGRLTLLTYDDKNSIEISIANVTENFDFEKDFSELKASTKDLTLVKADKDAENKTMHLQVKDKTVFRDIYKAVNDRFVYRVTGVFDNENSEIKDECMRIIETFTLGFVFEDIYDLSNVKDGVRRFESEDMNFSIDVPSSYIMSDENAINIFRFANGDSSGEIDANVSIYIFSKSSVGSAESLANQDLEGNRSRINEEIATFSDKLKRASYDSIYTTAYEYEYEVNGTFNKSYTRDVFFELGNYVYNVVVGIKLPGDKEQATEIINSLDADEIDSSVVGDIIYNLDEVEGTYTVDELSKCTLQLPNDYEEYEATSTSIVYGNSAIAFGGKIYMGDRAYEYTDITYSASQFALTESKIDGNLHVKTIDETLAGKRHVVVIMKKTSKESVSYVETFYTLHGGSAYVYTAIYTERGYSESARQEIRDILESAVYE